MNPTLNSPKYADPKSLAFQMYKKQQDRKQRKGYPYDPQLEQRYFRRNEGTTDYATIPEVTLADDFVIEFDMYLNGFLSAIFGNTNGTGFLRFTSATSVRFCSDVTLVDFAVSAIDLNGFYKGVRLSRVSGLYKLLIGGVEYVGSNASSESFVINRLYQKGDNFYCDGILANLKIYDNGTLVRDYPINDNSDILRNKVAALGNEIDGLTYALTTAIGGVASVVLSSLSVIGKTYLVEVSYSGVVGDASVRIGGFSSPSFTGTGTIEFVATATTTVNDILGALTGVTSGSVTVSIKEADGYGTIINGNADDWGLFDKQADGDWLGQELVVNGGFDSTDGWRLGAGWSISDGLASHVSSSTSNLNQSANQLRESSVYLSSFSVTDVTPSVDGVRIRIGSGGNGVLREEEGTYSEIITATNNELLFTANAFFTGSIDNVSIKEVLKSA